MPLDALDVVLKEYETLRKEVVDRVNNGYQMIPVVGTLTIGTLAWSGSGHANVWFAASAISVIALFAITVGLVIRKDIRLLCTRLVQIEKRVNALLGEEVLEWETKWGALATGMAVEKLGKKISG